MYLVGTWLYSQFGNLNVVIYLFKDFLEIMFLQFLLAHTEKATSEMNTAEDWASFWIFVIKSVSLVTVSVVGGFQRFLYFHPIY